MKTENWFLVRVIFKSGATHTGWFRKFSIKHGEDTWESIVVTALEVKGLPTYDGTLQYTGDNRVEAFSVIDSYKNVIEGEEEVG